MIQNIKKIQSHHILSFIILSVFLFVPIMVFAKGLVPCGGGGGELDCDFNFLIQGINDIIEFLAVKIAAPLAAVAFSYAGWLYITGGSSASKREEANKIFTNVIIGLFFVFGAWLIVVAILKGLGVLPGYTEIIGL